MDKPAVVKDPPTQNEESFQLLVQTVKDYAIFMLDANGFVRTWNAGAERLKGYQAHEIIGQHFSKFYPAAAVAERLPETLLERARLEGRVEVEGERVRKDGSTFIADVVLTALYDQSGELRGYAKVTRDITERKKAEEAMRRKDEELVKTRKIEAIGRLAGGIAHDFNNLLTGIQGMAEDLRGSPETPPSCREELEEIIKATQRAASLIRRLLAFGRQQVISPVNLQINDVIIDMQKMIQRLIGEDIALKTFLAPSLWTIKADASQIQQIFVNLIVNARDAMPKGGTITIQTTNVTVAPNDPPAEIGVTPGDYVYMTIADTGTGMSSEVLTHIFEPYFTTKGMRGTGLGLATVYGAMKQNDGYVFAQSAEGQGTMFRLYFPATMAAAETVHGALRRSSASGTETILVVEDEDIVRRVMVRALTKRGYTVLEARSGQDALKLVASHPSPIHLLITDVIMPEMNGRVLAEALSAAHTGLKVLYTSGYAQDIVATRGILEPGLHFLAKTFTADQLLQRVRQVLDSAS